MLRRWQWAWWAKLATLAMVWLVGMVTVWTIGVSSEPVSAPRCRPPMVEVVVEVSPGLPSQVVAFSLEDGDTFSLSFRHSVEQTMVYEEFRLDATDGLVLVSTRFSSLGAGLPYSQEDGVFHREGFSYTIDDLNRVLGSFSVMVIPENDYTIHHRLGTIRLTHVPYGARLVFRAMK